jgi:hypothetical protein
MFGFKFLRILIDRGEGGPPTKGINRGPSLKNLVIWWSGDPVIGWLEKPKTLPPINAR